MSSRELPCVQCRGALREIVLEREIATAAALLTMLIVTSSTPKSPNLLQNSSCFHRKVLKNGHNSDVSPHVRQLSTAR